MIELKNVTKKYGEDTAVDGVSLKIDKGDFCVLIGPSGCGKSTTLKMINRLIEPSGGEIFTDGLDVKKQKPEILRRGIGYVIQSVGLFPHMSVSDNIAVVPRLLKWENSRIDKQVNELLSLVELGSDYADKYPHQLSGGEAQRVGVARALAADADILLMDEPFGALDPVTREALQKGLLRIQKKLKKTVVFVTHDIDEAVRLATKIAIMKDGRVVQYDTPENILNNPADKFTEEFIGIDRALKNLTRMFVKDISSKVSTVKERDKISDVIGLFCDKVYLWVTDENGRFTGWLSKSAKLDGSAEVKDFMHRASSEQYCLSTDTTLKDALSKLVMNGVVVLPVSEDDLVIGEISLQSILESGNG
ncbi:MAG: glycine betaine ABC transporter ATP-binding protein [Denitrovibrio sp.]|nr:MAG: glycine betaine ABC transporter ATP-binding protein [Denitrovibrio sp.]